MEAKTPEDSEAEDETETSGQGKGVGASGSSCTCWSVRGLVLVELLMMLYRFKEIPFPKSGPCSIVTDYFQLLIS